MTERRRRADWKITRREASGLLVLACHLALSVYDQRIALLVTGCIAALSGCWVVVRRQVVTKRRHGPPHTLRGWDAVSVGIGLMLLGCTFASFAAIELGFVVLP